MGTDRDESSNIPLNRQISLITLQGQEEPRPPQSLERMSEGVGTSRKSCEGPSS